MLMHHMAETDKDDSRINLHRVQYIPMSMMAEDVVHVNASHG